MRNGMLLYCRITGVLSFKRNIPFIVFRFVTNIRIFISPFTLPGIFLFNDVGRGMIGGIRI